MARYKHADYNQTILIPIDFTKQIIPGTFAYSLSLLIDKHMQHSIFDKRYKNDKTGAPAYSPAILLKIILFAYYNGIKHSRKIERACRENVIFMALSANSHPDFTTIAKFISTMHNEISTIFCDVLAVCQRQGLISGKHLAIDGCKLPSNAAKEWSGTFGDLKNKKEKIKARLNVIIQEHKRIDNKESKRARDIDLRIKRHNHNINKIEYFLKHNEPRIGTRKKEVQSNITDNESAKMKSSNGVIQGYNGIALVDEKHQIIVAASAHGTGQEYALLQSTLNNFKENSIKAGLDSVILQRTKLLADNNYFSENNLEWLHKQNINAFIPDQGYRSRDTRFKTADRHKGGITERKKKRYTKLLELSDFKYHKSKDQFTCPEGKILRRISLTTVQKKNTSRRYVSRESDCIGCKIKTKCIRNKKWKRRNLMVGREIIQATYSRQMIKKMDAGTGRKTYSKRMGIVEPVFGNMAFQKNLNYFTMRGQEKVNVQWMLYSMVHNIEKISNYGKPHRL